jgi:hypothetical protein
MAIGSMALSATMQMMGNKNVSLFVGQWAPTFLIFGLSRTSSLNSSGPTGRKTPFKPYRGHLWRSPCARAWRPAVPGLRHLFLLADELTLSLSVIPHLQRSAMS